MNWTKELPTVPGFYWWKNLSDATPEVVEVARSNISGLWVGFSFCDDRTSVDVMIGHWCGPLEAPK